ncbi:helix-turn-helix domain-containing protein [Heyndrickxia coagulans]|uniref:helix-turn-helix domain-containing protein n=1 Tax=Heyndrickxia coagulans TaxID=1398 RepID=UPI002235CDE1|nr:helix-turn-helix domain-containing protein [Heyndrickxia coagulans]UZH06369.1 helix-turn-helix domain-containing protein [Heyndrickxia coagulans]UZH06425.1 helix-turn-helix domain-containing protein [Heyndrickxia coagulans]
MFAKRLKELRLKKKLSQQNMADFLGITRQGYAKYERTDSTGSQPDLETLNKLANFFGVSIDYLVKGENNSAKTELTEKDEKDIAKKMESILEEMDSDTALAFDGEPMDEETRELVRAAIESNLRLAKQIAKKKFTPKKYRDQDDGQ